MLNENGERELAYVVKVDKVVAITGADKVEDAIVGGWHCMVQKGDFHEGDKAVLFEIDSLVDYTVEPFEWMRSRKGIVKTQRYKFGGKGDFISQGLLMKLSDFKLGDLEVGTPLTQKLGVTYYSAEDRARKDAKPVKVNPNAKYQQMFNRHFHLIKDHKAMMWLYRKKWGKRLLYLFLGYAADNDKFPKQFAYVHKTDEERCLFAKTKILTDQGNIEISKIVNSKLNVKVLSVNPDGTLSYKKILDYQKFKNKEPVMTIYYPYSIGVKRNNSIVCTQDHRFLTDKGYIHASDLKIGDTIYTLDNGYNEDCIGAVYGMLLGDSHIAKDNRNNGKLRIMATNGEAQIDYLNYKKEVFSNNGTISDAGKGGYEGSKHVFHWALSVDGFIHNSVKNDCFIDNKKRVTKNMLDKVNAEGLAFWYMDDGNLSHREEATQKPSIRLNTQGFSKEENVLLCEMLNNKFGIDSKITLERREGKPDYYHIYINVVGTPKFLQLVTPYMCKSMAYKTLPELEYLLESQKQIHVKKDRLLPIPITNIEIGQKKFKKLTDCPTYMYDLEIEDNHNFISANIVSHNCENLPHLLEDTNSRWVKTTKIDGTSTTFILEKKPFGKTEFYVCSRNQRITKDNTATIEYPDQGVIHSNSIYWAVAEKYHIREFLEEMLAVNKDYKYVAIQGESAGMLGDIPIQGNPHHFTDLRFFGFNLIDSVRGRWDTIAAKDYCAHFEIEWVPIVETYYALPADMETFKLTADGDCEAPGATGLREGYVYRNMANPNQSFKNISREYLLAKFN